MSVQAMARLRYISIPPRKMRLVADMVKGLPVEKALDILNFTPRVAAEHIAKTLKSATANALSQEGTAQLRPEDLHVKNIMVDAAPTMKRIRFRSMGRVYRYRKRHCHLTVILEEVVQKKVPVAEVGDKAADADKAEVKPATKKKARKTAARKTAKKKAPAKKKTAKKKATREKAADGPKEKKKTSRKTATKKRASGKDKE
ncbi:MAG: 50S ribosomal protein L22 [Candidatus Zixiibacteriota bacterium]|nr:MAG: 50S ribosomal protein L22 [candidate division Zixibacteria bacterium]